MSIEIKDLDKWNAWLEGDGSDECTCCGMPECPEPDADCEQKYVSVDPPCNFWIYTEADLYGLEISCEDKCRKYGRKLRSNTDRIEEWEDSGSYDKTRTVVGDGTVEEWWAIEEGQCVRYKQEDWTVADSANYTYTGTPEHDDPTSEVGTSWGTILSRNDIVVSQNGGYSWTYTYHEDDTYTDSDSGSPEGSVAGSTLDAYANGTASGTTYDAVDEMYYSYSGVYSSTVTYSEPVGISSMLEQADEQLAEAEWADGDCTAERSVVRSSCGDPPVEVAECIEGLDEARLRYMWVIPQTHGGSYFKLNWDEVFFPEGWDDPENEPDNPDPIVTAKTWEWEGPGDPGDEESWQSPWSSEVKVPDGERGEVTLNNVKFTCYHGAVYGVKPQEHSKFTEFIPHEEQGTTMAFCNQQQAHAIALI